MANSKIWDQIIFWSYAALFFFVPLILTPWNYELFEFNKMVLVYLLTTIIVWAWINKMIIKKRVIFRRTFWDIPLLLFLVSQVISTLISIDRHTSIFGYYSRFHGGLLSTICYLLLYWAFVSNLSAPASYAKSWRSPLLDVKGRLIKIILFSGTLVALYGIAEHFGIDKNVWVQDVQNRVFSTLGQPNWLAAYLDVLIFIVLTKIISSSKTFPSILYTLYPIFYLCLLYTKSRSGFLGFIIPFLIFLTSQIIHSIREEDNKLNKKLLSILGITLTISLLIGIPFQLKGLRSKLSFSFLSDVQENTSPSTDHRPPITGHQNITPSSDIRKIVWKGAIELWRRYPLFGTGTETFAYAYYWVRPKEHNFTSEWDFLYNKAHNEFLNFAATTGTFGLLAYLLLIASVLFFSLQKNQDQEARTIIPLAFISISITNFFGFSVVPIAIFFFLLPALFFVSEEQAKGQPSQQTQNQASVYLIITTSLTLFLVHRIIGYWLADYHFAQGRKLEKAGYLSAALSHLDRAIKLNRSEPNFYSQRGVALAKLVATLAQNNQVQNQSERVNQFINQAISDSQKALKISSFHLNFYKNQAKMYYYLSFVKLDYLRGALDTLLAAEKLAPTDPKIPYNIGLIYQTFDDKDRAREYFQKALGLKPDYQLVKKALEKNN